MSVANTYAPVREQGDGAVVAFDFSFKIFKTSELLVHKVVRATDVVGTALTLDVDYTVAINTITEGGVVTYTVAPSALQDSYIRRSIPLTQDADIPTNNIFREVQIENALDKRTMIEQEQQVNIDRSVKIPEVSDLSGELPLPSAGKALLWNAAANGIENSTNDFDDLVTDSEAAQTAAELAETHAETAETNAETAETNAGASAAAALVSENNAAADEATIAGIVSAGGIVEGDGTVNPTQLLSNGDFESWVAGTAVAPDGWTASGAGIAIAREATIIKLGTYSTALTRAGTDCSISQLFYTGKGIAYWRGKTVTVGCWVYATVADRARIIIQDGVQAVGSSYHTGDSTWQWLTATRTIDNSAASIYVALLVENGDTTAYFDGAMLVEGESAFAFSPKPADYLEGTWTPTVTSGITSPTYSVQLGWYTKIGNLVTIHLSLILTGGTPTGSIVTISLPFTTGVQRTNVGSCSILVAASNGTNVVPNFPQSGTGVILYTQGITGQTDYVGTSLGVSGSVDITGSYNI